MIAKFSVLFISHLDYDIFVFTGKGLWVSFSKELFSISDNTYLNKSKIVFSGREMLEAQCKNVLIKKLRSVGNCYFSDYLILCGIYEIMSSF